MKVRNGQLGMSVTGWLFFLMILGFAITIGTRLVPHYMDHNTISSVLDGMTEERNMLGKSTTEIEGIITKRLKLNNIRDFDLDNNMTIKRPGDRIIIDLDYEVRVPVAGNVELIASFAKNVEIRD